jgi:hypothetical protein
MREDDESKKILELIENLEINNEEDLDIDPWKISEEPYDAISELIYYGKPAVKPLSECLCIKPSSTWSAVYVAKILGEIGDPEAIIPLIIRLTIFTNESEVIVETISDALRKFGLAAVDDLISFNDDLDYPEKYYILNKINSDISFYDPRIADAFIKALSSHDEEIKCTAIKLLHNNINAAEPHLEPLLENPNQRVVEAATEALKELRTRKQEWDEEHENGIDEEEEWDKWWYGEMEHKTLRFLFEGFYQLLGFNYRAETEAAWEQNIKILLDWDSIYWNEEEYCIRNKEPENRVINFMVNTLNLPKTDKRRFIRHLKKVRRSLGLDLIFPVETENKLWNYLEFWGVETKQEFNELKAEIFEKLGPPPYEFVKILRPRKNIQK